jgi:hypothetical protein
MLIRRVVRAVRKKLATFDESGMGYWRVRAVLADGRVFENVYVNDLYEIAFPDLDVDGGLTSIQSPPIVLPAGGTASNVAGAWTTRTANISAWAGQTIQLRVEALDANPGSLIEAGVDNVTIIRQ